jgi:hypothetical protein
MGGLVGAAVHAALVRPPEPRVVVVERPAPPMAATATAAAPAPATNLDMPPPAAHAPAVGTPAPRSSGAGTEPSQLAAERAALDEARALIVQGDPAGALERLRATARRFPRPVLGEERDALTVEALVGAGRDDEARALADRFQKRAPGSLFAPTVASAVCSIADGGATSP